jgi:hypothetical protein
MDFVLLWQIRIREKSGLFNVYNLEHLRLNNFSHSLPLNLSFKPKDSFSIVNPLLDIELGEKKRELWKFPYRWT